MINKYPLWKNLLLVFVAVFALVYAAPNLYGDDPSIQISSDMTNVVDQKVIAQVEQALMTNHLPYKAISESGKIVLIRFADTDIQLKAIDVVKSTLGENYSVALNLVPATPHWLSAIGATPMKLGLDLRGGIHFLLDVDVDAVAKQRQEGALRTLSTALREENVRYVDLRQIHDKNIMILFRDQDQLDKAYPVARQQLPELEWTRHETGSTYELEGQLTPAAINEIRQYAIDQTMVTLRNRVNELGISEALVQQQGPDRVAVDLPGVQDSARAKEILGGTATLEFRMVDEEHDPRVVATGGLVPPGSRLYNHNNEPILLKDPVILTGNSITNAGSGFSENGTPSVNIQLGGGGESYFSRVTRDNVGKLMAVVYLETKVDNKLVDGKQVKDVHKIERVISVATIQSALGNRFQITGLRSPDEARDLALMLRAGALPAPISIVEERLVGPSLGVENIRMGFQSIVAGFLIVVVFMAIYYSVFGLIADLALTFNLILLVAFLSILGMTLTLPGMAGIVLTVGMAVDANVLIFERIREELRLGASVQAAIFAGYDRALATIIDANLTTLIVALILFGIGTGPVKGFAVTLTVGLLTSMLTGIMFTRAIVNFMFGRRSIKSLPIGI